MFFFKFKNAINLAALSTWSKIIIESGMFHMVGEKKIQILGFGND